MGGWVNIYLIKMHGLAVGTIAYVVVWAVFTIVFTTCAFCTTKDRRYKKDQAQ